MQLIPVLLIFAVGVAAYYYGRDAGKPDEQTTMVTQKARSWAGTAREKTGSWTETSKGWLRIGKAEKEAEQLRAWVASLPGVDKDFTTWLAGLSPEETKKFLTSTAAFMDGLSVERDAIVSGQVEDNPELKKGVEDAMVSYCIGYWKSSQIQENAVPFATFQAWQKDPSKKKHREFGQKLFVKMVNDGLISVSADLYVAPEKERRAYMAQSIRDFAEKDRPAFNAILKKVVFASTEEPAPIEKTPAVKKSRSPKPKAKTVPATS